MLRLPTLALLTALAAPLASAAPHASTSVCPPPPSAEKCAARWPALVAAPRDGLVIAKATPPAGAGLSKTAASPLQTPTLRPGESAQGVLGPDDPTLDDGSAYDLYRLEVVAGRRYTLTLSSDDFDAYLAIGTLGGDGSTLDVTDSDDDDGGGTDSRIAFTAPATGALYARANSLSEGDFGAYTLSLALASDAVVVPIAIGQTVQGALESTDATLGDGSHADLYTFRAEAGEMLEITLASDDFDAYLFVGTGSADDFTELDSNDDGAGPDDGTHARIAFTAPAAGTYLVRVNSLTEGETGRYRLRIDRR